MSTPTSQQDFKNLFPHVNLGWKTHLPPTSTINKEYFLKSFLIQSFEQSVVFES